MKIGEAVRQVAKEDGARFAGVAAATLGVVLAGTSYYGGQADRLQTSVDTAVVNYDPNARVVSDTDFIFNDAAGPKVVTIEGSAGQLCTAVFMGKDLNRMGIPGWAEQQTDWQCPAKSNG